MAWNKLLKSLKIAFGQEAIQTKLGYVKIILGQQIVMIIL